MKLPAHWVTKDKRSIPIKEMTDAHLINSIAMVQRRLEEVSDAYDACYSNGLQGEMASYYAEQEAAIQSGALLKLSTAEQALTLEVKRRQITIS